MTDACDDDDVFDDDDELDPAREIELAMQDCGQNADATWCAHGGTEHCEFRCLFRRSLKARP